MEVATVEAPPSAAGGKRKCRRSFGLRDLHDDMLERVLAHLPSSSSLRLHAVYRCWRAAATSPMFLDPCARIPSCERACDPWFLILSASDSCGCRPAVAYEATMPPSAPGTTTAPARRGLVRKRLRAGWWTAGSYRGRIRGWFIDPMC